jgi:hypothetical protein
MRDLTIEEQIAMLTAHIKPAEALADNGEATGYKDNAQALRQSLIPARRTLLRLGRRR